MNEINKKFKEIFSNLLVPQGFVYWRGLFVRLVNDEVIHSISCYKRNKFSFTIEFNVNTIYEYSLEKEYLLGGEQLCDFRQCESFQDVCYEFYNGSLEECMIRAYEHTKEFALPVINKVDTLDKVLEYCVEYAFGRLYPRPIWRSVFYLMIVQQYEYDFEAHLQRSLENEKKMIAEGLCGEGYTYEEAEKLLREPIEKLLYERERILNNKDELEKVKNILEERYRRNRKQLIKMGLMRSKL